MKKVQRTFDSGARARFSEPRDKYRVKKFIIINFLEFIEVALILFFDKHKATSDYLKRKLP